jgi:hypothetical protein
MAVDLEAVLARIRADRAEAQAQFNAAQAQLNAAQARLDELASMEASVQVTAIAAEKYDQAPQATQHADQPFAQEPGWATLTNKDAALTALTAIGRPASTREVYDKLRSAGRTEEFEQVRAALGDLKRKGKLSKANREQWQPPLMIESRTEVPAKVTEPHPAIPEITPTGMNAAMQVLQGDTTRFWTVREVWDEQVRRGWAKPTEDGHEAVRKALVRLRKRDSCVQFVEGPTYTYRWVAEELAPSNGSGRTGA